MHAWRILLYLVIWIEIENCIWELGLEAYETGISDLDGKDVCKVKGIYVCM